MYSSVQRHTQTHTHTHTHVYWKGSISRLTVYVLDSRRSWLRDRDHYAIFLSKGRFCFHFLSLNSSSTLFCNAAICPEWCEMSMGFQYGYVCLFKTTQRISKDALETKPESIVSLLWFWYIPDHAHRWYPDHREWICPLGNSDYYQEFLQVFSYASFLFWP